MAGWSRRRPRPAGRTPRLYARRPAPRPALRSRSVAIAMERRRLGEGGSPCPELVEGPAPFLLRLVRTAKPSGGDGCGPSAASGRSVKVLLHHNVLGSSSLCDLRGSAAHSLLFRLFRELGFCTWGQPTCGGLWDPPDYTPGVQAPASRFPAPGSRAVPGSRFPAPGSPVPLP